MLRRILFWCFTLLALGIIGGYVLLFPPLPITPQIASGLPSNFAEADKEFGRRVSAAFPLPLTVDELITRLSDQGFSVNTETNYAVFEKGKFPCTLIWRIHWEVEGGSVNELTSKYGGVCL